MNLNKNEHSFRFYQLTARSFDNAVMRLLNKMYARGLRVLVNAEESKRLEHLDRFLWQSPFLPHGLVGSEACKGFEKDQPILLSTIFENVNEADMLLALDCFPVAGQGMDVCFLFSHDVPATRDQARAVWKKLVGQGYKPEFWRLN